jgi:hypothetical protein
VLIAPTIAIDGASPFSAEGTWYQGLGRLVDSPPLIILTCNDGCARVLVMLMLPPRLGVLPNRCSDYSESSAAHTPADGWIARSDCRWWNARKFCADCVMATRAARSCLDWDALHPRFLARSLRMARDIAAALGARKTALRSIANAIVTSIVRGVPAACGGRALIGASMVAATDCRARGQRFS